MTEPKFIRNFAIVAHIYHGKSTLADRLLEITGTVEKRMMVDQFLDSNPIERERGITIKLAPVTMHYKFQNNDYILNLIDTPGHVDFSYEVSRSLAGCEGIILVIDAAKGIQAQTVAHFNLIRIYNLKVIPVVNKIDLAEADIDSVSDQLVNNFNLQKSEIIYISARTGENVRQIPAAIIERIPAPSGRNDIFRALVFSSQYDPHLGVVVYVKLKDGNISQTDLTDRLRSYKFYSTKALFKPIEIGIFTPQKTPQTELGLGSVGYIATGLKNIRLAQIGDTVVREAEDTTALPGFVVPTPFVFLSLYPTDSREYLKLREGLAKLQLTDSSITIKPASSPSLGKGFLCGFLGLLHADITVERLNREYNLNLVATVPTVSYQIKLKDGSEIQVKSADDYPETGLISEIREPLMNCEIFTPKKYLGDIMQICQGKRATFIDLKYFEDQVQLTYLIPLSEMIVNFFDKIKSVTQGFASLDYQFYQYEKVNAVKLEILINHLKAGVFSQIVVGKDSYNIGQRLVTRLKQLIPKHQFQIAIQAEVNGKIIARSDIPALRKDVTAKLYGGDQTRKDKLLDAQKRGKKKMRSLGKIQIPQEVFLKINSF